VPNWYIERFGEESAVNYIANFKKSKSSPGHNGGKKGGKGGKR
jgi:hypothetical protein